MIFHVDEYVGHPTWFPRRPFVAVPDALFMVWPLLLAFQTDGLMRVYFSVVFLQFAFSAIHHWLPLAAWHHLLDRLMIFGLIVATPLPYFVSISASSYAWLYYGCVVSGFVGALYLLLTFFRSGIIVSPDIYKPVFVLGAISLLGAVLPNLLSYVLLWLGVAFYSMNGLVVDRLWPTVVTYRVVQHIFLYTAFGFHQYTAQMVS